VVMRLVVVVFEFALKVGRKDRVHGSGVDVTGFSMMGIRLGMDMEQGEGEQPEYHPSTEEVSNVKTFSGQSWSCRQHFPQTLS